MANYTPNLQLEKPLGTEYYDIAVHNGNSDKIENMYNDLWKIKAKIIGNTSTNTDLNTIVAPGFYESRDQFNLWTNLPTEKGTNGAFTLRVESVAENGVFGRQWLADYTTNKEWSRNNSSSTTTPSWQAWEKVIASVDVVNNLTTTATDVPLSANMGKQLKDVKFENFGEIIPNGTNLNTWLKVGHARTTTDANTATMTNTPFSGISFSMIVESIGTTYFTQTAYRYTDNLIRYRVTANSGSTWTAWTDMPAMTHLSQLAGGTIRGYIEDTGTKTVGEIWLSRNNIGTYKCLTTTTETFIDANKWLRIDEITTGTGVYDLGFIKIVSGSSYCYKYNDGRLVMHLRTVPPNATYNFGTAFGISFLNTNYVMSLMPLIGGSDTALPLSKFTLNTSLEGLRTASSLYIMQRTQGGELGTSRLDITINGYWK